MAFLSTLVILLGQQIRIVGRLNIPLIANFLKKKFSIISVTSKSAITPSFKGRIANTLPGVLPSISFASWPAARHFFVSASIATTLGSSITIPSPFTYINKFAVPKSIPTSFENIVIPPFFKQISL